MNRSRLPEAITDFFELRGDRSAARARAAELVRGHPATRYEALSPEEQTALDEACRRGMALLGRVA